jgi:hypothetical protein
MVGSNESVTTLSFNMIVVVGRAKGSTREGADDTGVSRRRYGDPDHPAILGIVIFHLLLIAPFDNSQDRTDQSFQLRSSRVVVLWARVLQSTLLS